MNEAKIDYQRIGTLLRSDCKDEYEAAFEFVIRNFASVVIGYLVRDGMPYEHAKDICAECWAELWNSRHRTFFPNQTALRSWLIKVARNIAIDEVRARKNATCVPLEEANDKAQENQSGAFGWELIEQALPSLSEIDQDVLNLQAEGNTYAEIGAILDMSPAAAGMRVTRAKQRLRSIVERLISDEPRRNRGPGQPTPS